MSIRTLLLSGAAGAILLSSIPAQAQEGAPVETAIVTGTRIIGANIDTPTPVTAVSAATLEASAPFTLADALNDLPSLYQSGGQQNNFGSMEVGKNELNLRGLGAGRTLVLVDGVRFPSTQNNNTVDTNILPQALVKRVDIVTGGASASYGSDAVAGAVNFVLDDNFSGLKGNLSGGISDYGDNEEVHATLTGGQSFFGGRLHVIGSVEYFDNFGVAGTARAFRTPDPNVVAGPATAATNLILVPDLRSISTFGGYVAGVTGGTAAAQAGVLGTQFNNAGQLVPYNKGTPLNASYQSGGDGVDTSALQDIERPLRRRTAFVRGSYDITDNLSFYVDALWGHSDAEQHDGEFAIGTHAVTVGVDNPYLNAATAASLKAAGITALTVSRYFNPNTELDYQNNDRTTTQVATGGFTGKLGRFNWGASGTYGYTREYTIVTNDLNWTNLALAADAVTNPATGLVVCRSTLTNPTNGCVPADIFGTNNLTPAAINYITGPNPVNYDYETEGAEFHVSGALFDLPAGPVTGATGFEYRRQRDTVISNPLGIAKVYQFNPTQPWSGGYDVSEGFAEFQIPVLADLPWAKSLDLNLAARETTYSTSGDATTWKAGLIYRPNDEITVRGNVSRDIRAPNPSELFSAGTQGSGNVNDPFNNNAQVRNIAFITTGNPNLKPERSTAVTGGVTYVPDWARGLSLSVDYYNVRVAGVIATLGVQNTVNFCYQGITSYCQYVQRNGTGTITGVVQTNLNLNSMRTNGVDLEADYLVPASDWFNWWQGSLSVRSLANYLGLETTISPGAAPVYNAGNLVNGTPHWRSLTNINYDLDDFSTFLQVRLIGAGVLNNTYNNVNFSPYQTANFNHVPIVGYLDLQETYHFDNHVDFYVNIQNLLDSDPPLAPSNTTNFSQTTVESLYDQIGRMFRVGVKFKL